MQVGNPQHSDWLEQLATSSQSDVTETTYIVAVEDGIEYEELSYAEVDYDLAQDVYHDACELAIKDKEEVEISLMKRFYFDGTDEVEEETLLTNY